MCKCSLNDLQQQQQLNESNNNATQSCVLCSVTLSLLRRFVALGLVFVCVVPLFEFRECFYY